MIRQLLLLTLFFIFGHAADLPSNFKKCNRKRPDLQRCVFDAATDGIAQLTRPFPEINVPRLDPFQITAINFTTGSMKFSFGNSRAYGLSGVKLDTFEFDLDRKALKLAGDFPNVTVAGEYAMDGQLLVLSLKGNGHSWVTLNDVRASANFTYEEKTKKGKTYIKFVSIEFEIKPSSVAFGFDNLFKDEALNANVNKVLNDNWRTVYDEVFGSLSDVISQILLSTFNSFFSKVSLEEAFD